MKLIVAMVLAYLIGSIPWGLWLGRMIRNLDIREHGSHNIGATNAWRVLGPKLGVTVLVLDVLKGAIPVVLLPALLGIKAPSAAVELSIGAAAILGHVFPAFLQFRGGKGVATALGVFLAIAPAPMIVTMLVGIIIIARWGYVSAASVSGAVLFPMLLWMFGESPLVLFVSVSVCAGDHREAPGEHRPDCRGCRIANLELPVPWHRRRADPAFRFRAGPAPAMTGRIAVLGAGAWGVTLADLLARKGIGVRIWDIDGVHLARLNESREPGKPPGLRIAESLAVEKDFPRRWRDADVLVCARAVVRGSLPVRAVEGCVARSARAPVCQRFEGNRGGRRCSCRHRFSPSSSGGGRLDNSRSFPARAMPRKSAGGSRQSWLVRPRATGHPSKCATCSFFPSSGSTRTGTLWASSLGRR